MLPALFALLLAVTAAAKCAPWKFSRESWLMAVYGATNCSKSHHYEEFYGTFTTSGCYAIKVSAKHINDVKSFIFMGSDQLRVSLYDNPSCSGKPFARSRYSEHPSPYWYMNNVDGGPDGYQGFVAFGIDSYGFHW
ncbi:hypothetical protein BV22DRAFT_1033522 [Leucogyrophana mollusca]|uniref:Uncharacterized protein n=1 Tax=Leucogyrophana mollusca TaxID=85980 RepID=A0ACB8BKP2_9AGAM|nr:hypothetical protein BV22DRAFT_1033522 [Leucogyrophana mollusca]